MTIFATYMFDLVKISISVEFRAMAGAVHRDQLVASAKCHLKTMACLLEKYPSVTGSHVISEQKESQ